MLPTSPRLSQLAFDILKLNEEGYRDFVVSGAGNMKAHGMLSSAEASQLIAGEVKSPEMAQAVACSLWLWHDWLDEAHRLAQNIHNESGSYWHAIMHRRQGDFSNSKYWLARCRQHPVLQAIGNQATVLLSDLPADNRLLRLTNDGWNTEYFVDLVEQHQHKTDAEFAPILVVLQLLEWRVLTEYCASLA